MRDFAILAVLAACVACRSHEAPPSVYTSAGETPRNTSEAERLTKEAAEILVDQPSEAEELLRRALAEDLFFGPAHNNLGVVFLNRGDLYAAASEFE